MDQNETGIRSAVPNRAHEAGGILAWTAAGAPVAIVMLGVAATIVWAAFLGWCAVEAVRWAVG